jgi:hypothetical protein
MELLEQWNEVIFLNYTTSAGLLRKCLMYKYFIIFSNALNTEYSCYRYKEGTIYEISQYTFKGIAFT